MSYLETAYLDPNVKMLRNSFNIWLPKLINKVQFYQDCFICKVFIHSKSVGTAYVHKDSDVKARLNNRYKKRMKLYAHINNIISKIKKSIATEKMTQNKKNTIYIYKPYMFFTGLVIIIILCWNRILKVRLPKDLPFVFTDVTFLLMTLSCILLLISIVMLFGKKHNQNNIARSILEFYKNSLHAVDWGLKNKFNFFIIYKDLHIKGFNILKRLLPYRTFVYCLIHLVFVVLPICLFLDIFLYKYISFFYKTLLLVLIPLSYQYVLHSLHLFYLNELLVIKEILDLKITKNSPNSEDYFYIDLTDIEPLHFFIQQITLDRLGIKENDYNFQFTLTSSCISQNHETNYLQIYNENQKKLARCSDFFEII